MRPRIGITASVEEAAWGPWRATSALVPLNYVRAVERAGGTPVILPPTEDGRDEMLDGVDGVLFTGGGDLGPDAYAADAHPHTAPDRPERDRFELDLLRAALDRDMPVLAVCRGSQVLNVARGGDLVQHLPEVVGHEGHKEVPGTFADHEVRVEPGSALGRIVGERGRVKSHHHQGYGRIGEGLEVVAWADDGTVEAVEDRSRRFALGVLWHPEEGEDFALFEALVEAAVEHRAARAGGREVAG
jgi:gamma-glutamyl-gamma-aminobutyrate hydrolase PuuD